MYSTNPHCSCLITVLMQLRALTIISLLVNYFCDATHVAGCRLSSQRHLATLALQRRLSAEILCELLGIIYVCSPIIVSFQCFRICFFYCPFMVANWTEHCHFRFRGESHCKQLQARYFWISRWDLRTLVHRPEWTM